jgi:hypothetical protein
MRGIIIQPFVDHSTIIVLPYAKHYHLAVFCYHITINLPHAKNHYIVLYLRINNVPHVFVKHYYLLFLYHLAIIYPHVFEMGYYLIP